MGSRAPDSSTLEALAAAVPGGQWRARIGQTAMGVLYSVVSDTGVEVLRSEDPNVADLAALLPILATEVIALREELAKREARPLPEGWTVSPKRKLVGPKGQTLTLDADGDVEVEWRDWHDAAGQDNIERVTRSLYLALDAILHLGEMSDGNE